MLENMDVKIKNRNQGIGKKKKRGRLAIEEWEKRTRFILRHLDDPIAIQRSPICRLNAIERLAKTEYPNGIVSRGRALHDLIQDCLLEIEQELHDHSGLQKFAQFISLTRQGHGPTKASKVMGVSPEHASRTYKRMLVKLLSEKLMMKLR